MYFIALINCKTKEQNNNRRHFFPVTQVRVRIGIYAEHARSFANVFSLRLLSAMKCREFDELFLVMSSVCVLNVFSGRQRGVAKCGVFS